MKIKTARLRAVFVFDLVPGALNSPLCQAGINPVHDSEPAGTGFVHHRYAFNSYPFICIHPSAFDVPIVAEITRPASCGNG